MNGMNRVVRAALTALTAALMAGCAAHVIGCAPGFDVPFFPIYAAAFAAAALTQAGSGSKARRWICATAVLLLLGGIVLGFRAPIGSLIAAAKESGGLDKESIAAFSRAGLGVSMLGAALLGTLFTLMLNAVTGVAFALLIEIAAILCALTVNPEISLWTAVPGMAAGLAAFGLSADARREGMRPALVATAVVVVAAALLFVPAERLTWKPLEELAARVRSVTDDYASFTEQRVAFSIAEKGYDHGALIEDTVVSMLGGRATPSDDEVLRVRTDTDVLLRGTVRRTYTGYSWIDDQPKPRYLYYDFTHRSDRAASFGTGETAKNDAFRDVNVSVEMLEEGASTLFVPAHLEAFEMDLQDAVYYNTAGEIFLTRRVQAGDAYSLTARLPESDAALIEAAREAERRVDPRYAQAYAEYSALPQGISTEVYNLAGELAQGATCAAEKAVFTCAYLAKNCRYTLDGAYPELGKDFVSWFLLESKEGYCSYFASAMTVLCRAMGMPARYVEGYYVRANDAGDTIVTGHNAHAWVEVYLNGLGWVAFDPTARAYEAQNGGSMESANDGDSSAETDAQNPPDSGDSPNENSDNSPNDNSGDTPNDNPNDNPNDEPDDAPDDNPNDTPDDEPDDLPPQDEPPQNEPEKKPRPWWILLIVLLLAALALAVLWARRRLAETDPLRMAENMEADAAALTLYRANLTLLAQYGLSPDSGETPEAFASRAAQSTPESEYANFVSEVARSRYSGKSVSVDVLAAGENAYRVFLSGLRPAEKLRYNLRRMLRGIGPTDVIP